MAKENEEMISKPSSSICISSTNWIVSSSNGNLDDSISFDTPISSALDDDDDFHDSKSLKQHQSVVLNSCSSSDDDDANPCEIKLSFEQRHEIRQIYVRSTARVFEIYYATGPQSSNEYLCTVRCGIAAKEDAPLSTSDTVKASFAHLEGSTDQNELCVDKNKNDSNSNSNSDEDGWVEVKVPDSALLDSKTCSVAKKTEKGIQDFYEATAEITDLSPCISLTIRLLSLHTKGCIHIEEIYIFGEPVELNDSDDKVDTMKRSTESSMMAMLVPTLMQLSQTGMLKGSKDKHISEVRKELNHHDKESLDPNIGRTKQEEAQSSLPNWEEVDVKAASEGSSESKRIQSDKPGPGAGQGPEIVNHLNDSSSGCIEKVLNQLVCRVGRIEAFCSRFEESMLKPICNIETRLERLEQQLEILTMRSHSPELYPCTRITAPDFSCIESETSSLQNNENENNCGGMSDFASKDTKFTRPPQCFSDESESCSRVNDRNDNHCCVEPKSFLKCDASDSALAPQIFPGLIITVPEYSSEDDGDNDDENSHFGGIGNSDDKDCTDDFASAKMGFPVNKPAMSLDDALAMALAGFMSTASDQPPKINHSFIVEAPEFPYESSGGSDSLTSGRGSRQRNADSSEHNGTQNSVTLDSTSSGSSQDNEIQIMRWPNDDSNEDVIRDCLLQEEGTDGSCGDKSVNKTIAGNSDEVEGEVNNISMEDKSEAFSHLNTLQDNAVQVMRFPNNSSAEAVTRGCLFQDEGTSGNCDEKSVNETIAGNSDVMEDEVNYHRLEDTTGGLATRRMDNLNLSLNGEGVKASPFVNPGSRDEMETMLDRNFNSIVDFELPVLDVKFVPHEHLNTRGSLETLLSDGSEAKVEDSSTEDNSGSVPRTGQSQLSLEDRELKNPAADHLLVKIENVVDCLIAGIPDMESKIHDSAEISEMELSSLI